MLRSFAAWLKSSTSRARRRQADRRGRKNQTTLRIETLESREVMNGDPLGPEFQVNSTLAGDQELLRETKQAVASDAAGNYIIVWQAANQAGGNASDVYAQRYNAEGAAIGGEFRVNSYTTGSQQGAGVAMDAAGNFVVVWHTGSFTGGNGFDVVARRFDSTGAALGDDFRVNSYTTGTQQWATVAMDADGDFVVAWTGSAAQPGGASADVYAQRYNAAGVAQGSEFRVNSYTTSNQNQASVAMDGDGDFVVVWTSSGQTGGSGLDVFGQRFDALGAAQGAEFRVNTFTSSTQNSASVAMARDADSGFVVVWESMNQTYNPSGYDIYAKRFDAAGTELAGEFRVNEYSQSWQAWPSVAMAANGDFVVGWAGLSQPGGNAYDVYARRYNAAGAATTSEFRVNETTTYYQRYVSVAPGAGGSFIAAWSAENTTASDFGNVFARRFGSQLYVSQVRTTTGEAIDEDEHLSDGPTALVVGFNRDVSTVGGTAGAGSVLNRSNWRLTRNAVDVSNLITSAASYGFNSATNRWEVTLTFASALTPGDYQLTAFDEIQTLSGVLLDGDYNGAAGGDFVRGFTVEAPVVSFLSVVSVSVPGVGALNENQAVGVSPSSFVVVFNSAASVVGDAAGANSVTNADNWMLLRNGILVEGAIDSVSFAFNSMSGYWEAVVDLAIDLGDGDYQLIASDAIQSELGVALDGDANGAAGGNFTRSFVIDLPTASVFAVVDLSTGAITENEVLTTKPTLLAVLFTAEMSTTGGSTGAHSVANRNNWRLTRNGVDATTLITGVTYVGYDAPSDSYIVLFNLGSAVLEGDYQLTAYDTIYAAAGTALDGDANGVAGGSFVRHFAIDLPDLVVEETRVGGTTTAFAEGAVLPPGPGSIVLVFNQTLSINGGTTSAHSVYNLANWSLTRDGVDVSSEITGVTQAYDSVARKYHVTVTFAGPLTFGEYQLIVQDSLHSIHERPIDGDGDGIGGGDFVRSFRVQGAPAATVAGVYDGEIGGVLHNGGQLARRTSSFIITIAGRPNGNDESDLHSVYNLANYQLARNGVVVEGAIEAVLPVGFGLNGELEVAVRLTEPLAFGEYVLTLFDSIHSTVGDPLDGDGDGQYGGHFHFAFEFREPIATGPEFLVNTTTAGDQQIPAGARRSIASDANGNYVVVWQATQPGSNGLDVYARRFNGQGAPLGAEFRVNTYTVGAQSSAAVAMDSNGDFVIAWSGLGYSGGSGYDIYAKRFSSTGAAVGAEFRVNAATSGNQTDASVAMDANGNFVVAWTSVGTGSSGADVFARRFNAAGTPLATDFRVNSYTASTQHQANVAMSSTGAFVVAWTSLDQTNGGGSDVYARRYSASGTALASEFRINNLTLGSQERASIAMNASGQFAVAWASGSTTSADVYLRRYSSGGAALETAILVNEYTTGLQHEASVAIRSDGDVVVAWTSVGQPGGDLSDVYAREFFEGEDSGAEFRVNSGTSGNQSSGNVAVGPNGVFIIAGSTSDVAGGSDGDVFVRLYSEPLTVTRVRTAADEFITPGETLEAAPVSLGVHFNVAPAFTSSTTHAASVRNLNNWKLFHNGVDVSSLIVGVNFGGNPSLNLYSAAVNFVAPLADGDYELRLLDSAQSAAGQALDGDADGTAGGDFVFAFSVAAV